MGEHEFKDIYLQLFKALRTFMFSKCSDLTLAEDLAQEAFVRLWHNKNKIDGGKAKSYLFTVANNLFLDHVRHHKVKSNYAAAFVTSKDVKDPQYYMEMEEFKQKLDLTIESMPDGAREVFLMNRMEKMTYQQIANTLELSVKAIEKRMQKALEVLSTLQMGKI